MFGSGPVFLVENELFIWSLFYLVNLTLFIEHEDVLLARRVILDVAFEAVNDFIVAAEEDHGREVLIVGLLPFLLGVRSFLCEPTINRLVINEKFELMGATSRSLTIVPDPEGAKSLRLIEND